MGCRPGLDRITELMELLGNPQNSLKYIHIAGSNGKGSTAAMLSSILTHAGYCTGLFTSPHLLRYNERIKINNVDIPDEDLCAAAEKVAAAVGKMKEVPSEFERFTAIAFLYFQERGCDIVVLEVGLGGRLDCTNVIPAPEVAVITNIGLEHTDLLGDTLEKIAWEKAGIIKAGSHVVLYGQSMPAESVIRKKCEDVGCDLTITNAAQRLERMDTTGQTFSYRSRKHLRLNLLGGHQIHNAAVVLDVVDTLVKLGYRISEQSVVNGLSQVVWPARMEVLGREPMFLLDGAHNPQCMSALVESLQTIWPGEKFAFLTGVLADKDYREMTASLLPKAAAFFCVAPDSERALSGESLAEQLCEQGANASVCGNIHEGVQAALRFAEREQVSVIACGSLYMAGAIREAFHPIYRAFQREKGIAGRNALPPDLRKEYSRRIVQRIAESSVFRESKTVMLYRATKGEVDLSELEHIARRNGKRLAYPMCTDHENMIALSPEDPNCWEIGRYGIQEPARELSRDIPPDEIDLIICPCAAFDEEKRRMGMGAGYYDRFLPRCSNAWIATAAFECQKLSAIISDDWDIPMQAVFTEANTYGLSDSGNLLTEGMDHGQV